MEKFEVRFTGVTWMVEVPAWATGYGAYTAWFWEHEDAMLFMKKRLKEAKDA